mgnify:FL=1
MSEWALKRFWQDATIETEADGFSVRLDGRPVRTPGKRLLSVPTELMAQRIAAEWQAQTEAIDPTTMPWTRSANSALDKVSAQRDEVRDHLLGYAGTDLLSYRADSPEGLVERQAKAWDPLLDWLESEYGVRLAVTRGVMPVAQDPDSLVRLRKAMDPMSDFHLTGFHDIVGLSGSYVLALAAIENQAPAGHIWALSRIDEDWQAEQWGVDEDAAETAEVKKAAFCHATEFYDAA